jgi:hypothetical protein
VSEDVAARPRRFRRKGVAPELLLSQVRNTAAWALEGGMTESWHPALLGAPGLGELWREREGLVPYLRVMLASHFTSVATLVPTDVDAHIRYHIWQEIETREQLEAALAVVDEAATWSPRAVSERVVAVAGIGVVHGHAGEWLAVRAGALGRALEIGADDAAESLIAAIDREMAHEAEAFAAARASNDATLALRVATTLAHNGGDLSRVVDAFPKATPRKAELVERFARLGHEGHPRYDGEHLLAGKLNKAVMATENHRFLPLREARALRVSRALIVPIAPFLDGWGERIGREPLLEEKQRSDILGVLLHAHDASPTLASYVRGLVGLEISTKGGLARLAEGVSARTRKLLASPALREAMRTSEERFEAKMTSAYRNALKA